MVSIPLVVGNSLSHELFIKTNIVTVLCASVLLCRLARPVPEEVRKYNFFVGILAYITRVVSAVWCYSAGAVVRTP